MKTWGRFIAVFSIGFILGLTVMNVVHMHTIDRLYRIQNQLTNQLLDREIKLERLTESMEQQKASIVKDLVIDIAFEGNPLVQDEIEKSIHFYMSDLVGMELWRIDGEMIYKILDDRILDIGDRQVHLEIKYIVISEKISIAVIAKIIEKL
ncbi:hypothetical protein SAMN05660297_01760 [Natronincola peptidivorans]|uniref:Sporulation membrane protein YtrI C-terminal domain-containing protein n=1 Tax=Natronincola peptidivorans TaxID=426128 RepID=A0A1I0CTR6_9FIRM|nr:hypothetical protein [Natronincola peptidivorans]SET23117.1 hypothetical protein SAMN05660297_01760 [Natronincola peptidivorans]